MLMKAKFWNRRNTHTILCLTLGALVIHRPDPGYWWWFTWLIVMANGVIALANMPWQSLFGSKRS